ncbi:gliding motility-associated C-terminal domain-containing protein [Mucilaginibacter sp. FT3.2]|uniref:gliding motility-associated C-terminal domain-containing protein n=1 Tax=Mucilaginibacter sp. FT3.2 TaxID=2723090 RepID=UPI00160F7E7C|nr:gliding motility-associated-like protein [Mucilaginibacter sp. FT3.2]
MPDKEKSSTFEQKDFSSFYIKNISPIGHLKNKLFKNNAAGCDNIQWAKWSKFSGSNATGTIVEGNGNSVDVSMSSNFDFSSTPGIYNYWLFSYYPVPIPNETVPKTTWSAGNGGSTNMTFSHTVTNPVLLISSLGQVGQRVTLGFSLPYVVLYDGGAMTYDNSTSITGEEGYAIIMFPGDFKSVVITSTTPEDYTNITWGLSQPAFLVNITTASFCGSTTATASGGVSYIWNGGDSRSSATNTFHASGRYIVTVKNAGGCSASVSKQIDVHVPAALTVKGNLTGCGSVTATAFVDGAVSYQWDGGDTPNNAGNTFRTSGRYTVMATDAYQCRASRLVDVIVNQPVVPVVNITASLSGQICSGVPVTYSVSFLNGGDSPELNWLKNGTPVGAGKTYTAIDLANGDKIECALTSHIPCAVPARLISNSIIADVKATPTITFSQKIVIDGRSSSVQLNPVISGNIASYLWTPAEGLSNPNIQNPLANPVSTTDYTLTVVSATGCQATAIVRVLVLKDIMIPNSFTPNGDGINDTWEITNLADFPKATIYIYNRYGANLYHSIGYARPWNGVYKGKELPAGTYYYLINLHDQAHGAKSGWVAILR